MFDRGQLAITTIAASFFLSNCFPFFFEKNCPAKLAGYGAAILVG